MSQPTQPPKPKKPHRVRRFLIWLAAAIALLILALVLLFRAELSTLYSLRQLDPHPLYTMAYAGDYGFDDFLKVGARSDSDIERFVMRRLLRGVDLQLNIASAGCSAFVAQNANGERLFARNFDFDFAPALFLRTRPAHGFASVSMVNLAFAGYGPGYLPTPQTANSFLTLAGPYLPFDGMNEKGLAMALLAVPHAEPRQTGEGVMLNTTALIRLVLDQAATVEEALALVDRHPLYFSGDVPCHFLIADATGDSAIVEFLDGRVCVTRGDGMWQAVTNFIVFEGRNEGEGGNEFLRYQTLADRLTAAQGVLTEEDAMALLASVRIQGRTQWSLVYNLTTGAVTACMGGEYAHPYTLAGE